MKVRIRKGRVGEVPSLEEGYRNVTGHTTLQTTMSVGIERESEKSKKEKKKLCLRTLDNHRNTETYKHINIETYKHRNRGYFSIEDVSVKLGIWYLS